VTDGIVRTLESRSFGHSTRGKGPHQPTAGKVVCQASQYGDSFQQPEILSALQSQLNQGCYPINRPAIADHIVL